MHHQNDGGIRLHNRIGIGRCKAAPAAPNHIYTVGTGRWGRDVGGWDHLPGGDFRLLHERFVQEMMNLDSENSAERRCQAAHLERVFRNTFQKCVATNEWSNCGFSNKIPERST